MREREVINNMIKLIYNDNTPNLAVLEYVKLDEDSMQEEKIKHFCTETTITSEITKRLAIVRVLDKIATVHFAFCPHCKKIYYSFEYTEEVDLEPYKQAYKEATGMTKIPPKEEFILNFVFPTLIEITYITPYSAIVLEESSKEAVFNNLEGGYSNKELKDKQKPTSWDDI